MSTLCTSSLTRWIRAYLDTICSKFSGTLSQITVSIASGSSRQVGNTTISRHVFRAYRYRFPWTIRSFKTTYGVMYILPSFPIPSSRTGHQSFGTRLKLPCPKGQKECKQKPRNPIRLLYFILPGVLVVSDNRIGFDGLLA